MAKHLCDCGKIAQWYYMPSTDKEYNKYHCDDCISSPDDEGCSCNWRYLLVDAQEPEIPSGIEGEDWRWVPNHKESGAWQYLDEKGRPYPCCEYDFQEEGYDVEVKLFLTDEQKEWIKDIPQEHDWCKCDIYLKDGSCLKEEWITDKSYFWVVEDLGMSNDDIVKIVKSET